MIGYSIVGDDDAGEYFYIHPDNGDINLLKSVFESEKRQYKVEIDGSCSLFAFLL